MAHLCESFQEVVRNEFQLVNSKRQARDKLRNLQQRKSVSGYLNVFRNTVICIPGMTDDEKLDRFVHGLKRGINVEFSKSNPLTFEAAAQIALNIESAIYGARQESQPWNKGPGRQVNGGQQANQPVPMEIGHMQGRGRPEDDQQEKDRQSNA